MLGAFKLEIEAHVHIFRVSNDSIGYCWAHLWTLAVDTEPRSNHYNDNKRNSKRSNMLWKLNPAEFNNKEENNSFIIEFCWV